MSTPTPSLSLTLNGLRCVIQCPSPSSIAETGVRRHKLKGPRGRVAKRRRTQSSFLYKQKERHLFLG